VRAWRVGQAVHKATRDSAIGAHASGGRWNPKASKALYGSLDAATAILEVAVHKGFRALDRVPHVITSFTMADPSWICVVRPADVPNPGWLSTGMPSAGQQEFGAALLAEHAAFVIPSVVSQHSWNLVPDPDSAAGKYQLELQEPLAIDTRLNPPARPG
jgi:RES domain-containing protein